MDDLPELPFEKVLSYLNLEDRLRARAVSRRWYHKINSFKVKSLCCSERPVGRIFRKSRWVSGAFVENFINSTRFASFFDTYGQTILSNLKHLRLCDLHLNEGDRAAFTRTLNSFGQLEELDIVRADFSQQDVLLNLPMLTSLQLEEMFGIEKLTLEAPRLQQVKILDCSSFLSKLRVEIVHGESVERLLVDYWRYTDVKKLKNLKALYIREDPIEVIYPTFLSNLQQLKEIHIQTNWVVAKLFEQKQRSGRADLKIYFRGLLLNGPEDPAINALPDSFANYLSRESLACLVKNPSRLADEIPFYRELQYSDIKERVVPGLEVDLLKRFTDLNKIKVNRPVQDILRFLDLLKNCKNIVELVFDKCDQPQDLFDRLPEHCVVQKLFMFNTDPPSDLAFLFRLKHLIKLSVFWSIDSETVRRAFEELPALSYFGFRFGQKEALIEISQSKQFKVSIWLQSLLQYPTTQTVYPKRKTVSDLNAAIEFFENE